MPSINSTAFREQHEYPVPSVSSRRIDHMAAVSVGQSFTTELSSSFPTKVFAAAQTTRIRPSSRVLSFFRSFGRPDLTALQQRFYLLQGLSRGCLRLSRAPAPTLALSLGASWWRVVLTLARR